MKSSQFSNARARNGVILVSRMIRFKATKTKGDYVPFTILHWVIFRSFHIHQEQKKDRVTMNDLSHLSPNMPCFSISLTLNRFLIQSFIRCSRILNNNMCIPEQISSSCLWKEKTSNLEMHSCNSFNIYIGSKYQAHSFHKCL